MSVLTEKFDEIRQIILELEDSVKGASPIQAKIDADRTELVRLATQVENRIKDLANQELAVVEKSKMLDELKASLKEMEAGLKAKKTA